MPKASVRKRTLAYASGQPVSDLIHPKRFATCLLCEVGRPALFGTANATNRAKWISPALTSS